MISDLTIGLNVNASTKRLSVDDGRICNKAVLSGDGNWLAIPVQLTETQQRVVKVYNKVNDEWTLSKVLESSQAIGDNTFGDSIAINHDATIIAVGSPSATVSQGLWVDNPQVEAGYVHIFGRSPGSSEWKTQCVWLPGTYPTLSKNFGKTLSVSKDGNTIAVGQPYTCYQNDTASLSSNVWVLQRLQPDTPFKMVRRFSTPNAVGLHYGTGVKVSPDGNRVFCTSYRTDQPTNTIIPYLDEWVLNRIGFWELKFSKPIFSYEREQYGVNAPAIYNNIEIQLVDDTNSVLLFSPFKSKTAESFTFNAVDYFARDNTDSLVNYPSDHKMEAAKFAGDSFIVIPNSNLCFGNFDGISGIVCVSFLYVGDTVEPYVIGSGGVLNYTNIEAIRGKRTFLFDASNRTILMDNDSVSLSIYDVSRAFK